MSNRPNLKWLTQEAYDKLSTGEKALMWYRSWIGQREDRGSNRSKLIDWIGSLISPYLATGNEPYCAETLFAALVQAGVPRDKLPANPASVNEWRKWAERQHRRHDFPKRGRGGYWVGPDGKGHIFMVADDLTSKFRSLEGNTGPDPTTPAADREGDGFYERVRTMRFLTGHYRWGFIDFEGLV